MSETLVYGILGHLLYQYFQGYDSTGGMCALLDHPAREDGVLVKVLRKQGAVPYVRTNIPQLMMT